MKKRSPLQVLLLDDDRHLCELYRQELSRNRAIKVTTSTDSKRARELARRQLFDVVVIDAKLPYRGAQYGGLQLADDLRPRFGKHSIIVISQFITSGEIKAHEGDYEFLDKESGGNVRGFTNKLSRLCEQLSQQQFVFVAMPFHADYSTVYEKQLKLGIQRAGYRCVRADDIHHTKPAHAIIFELVENCKAVVFLADGANPNAYYEAGFADAMQKEVVIVSKTVDELKFDVSNRLAITYGARPSSLVARIRDTITSLRETGTNY